MTGDSVEHMNEIGAFGSRRGRHKNARLKGGNVENTPTRREIERESLFIEEEESPMDKPKDTESYESPRHLIKVVTRKGHELGPVFRPVRGAYGRSCKTQRASGCRTGVNRIDRTCVLKSVACGDTPLSPERLQSRIRRRHAME